MKISTLQYKNYSAKIFNISKNEDISDMVGECNIALPTSSLISSLEAKFNTETKLIDEENEISIQVLDEVKNIIYSLQGKAKINKRTKSYTGNEIWEYSVKDSYEKLFEKVLTENKVYHNLFMCNENDKNNSLLHIIAKNLGFRENEIDFVNLTYENGEFIRVPFVYLEENSRWIDILQTYIEASNGILYVKNKKLFFRPCNFNINSALSLDRTNIITNIEEIRKEVLQNGIKVPYDRFELGENQTVFNIKNKIIVDENTNKDTEVPTMRINYITSAVNEPTLTKATAYYFTSDDPRTMTMIELVENTHYVVESWKETGCEVKFYNPLRYKLYIDNFEIKGRPLTKYEDNEINITFKTVEKNQENFITKSKNRLIQTKKQAIFLSKLAMKREISNSYEYNFNTKFLSNLEVGQVYNFTLDDINTVIEIESINISLKTSDFRMSVKAREIKNELEEIKVNAKLSGNSNSQYIDLSSIEKELAENKQEISSIKSSFESLEQSIQDSKTKIYTLKPAISSLTDSNIGDMYISDSSAEILVKENNSLVWKPITDSSVRADLNEYIKSNDAKVIDIVYQNTEPGNPKNGDIWIDTGNDGIWKRYTNNAWIQIDESVRTAIATANTNISEIENKIKTINNTIDNKILAKAFVQEEQPTSGMKNHDIWYKPSNNTFKKWLNNRWNTATEDDIFPALRHYVSLATAQLDIGKRIDGVDEKAGMFLTNNNTKFGAKNGTLAEVSLSKTGEILIKNANNLIQWNVKDPTNPNRVNSQILLGVTDVNDPKWKDVIFAIGDEASPSRLLFRNGTFNQYIGGKEINEKFSEEQERVNLLSLMSTGKMLYTDPEFKNGINGISSTPYNNNRANDDCITFTREVIAQTNTLRPPNSSGYALKISKRVGTASPGSGGFYWGHASRKEAVFITRIIANIPIGYNIDWHSNASGNNRVVKWLTNVAGTGKYEEYIHYHKCGSDTVASNFSSTGYFAIHSQNGNNNIAVTWYLAYATVFDCTANRDEKIYEIDGKVDKNKTDVDKNINNLSKGISDSLNTAKSYTDSKKTEIENSLKKEITFEIGGEADKYYPVLFNSTNKQCRLIIYRNYNEKAPNSWNTATHKGALFLELTTNFYGSWSGNSPSVIVNKFDTNYVTPASKIEIRINPGVFIWLRGGGAIYHAYCDDFEVNRNLRVIPYINGYDSAILGGEYADSRWRFTLSAGTFEQTGSASSIKALYAKEQIKEVDRRLTNADGRLTQLQQNYQNTVQDVTNFKTQTADRIDTVQGALDNGNFVVNGNTTFADGVRFVSRGTNEVVAIANGAITLTRDGQKLTRIKNSRYGTIATDSAGKGVVNFPGFKQPMIVLTSIKSANFGKNMASVFCYAEHITGTQYRMFVGGTNEHYTEAKPITVVASEWSTTNAVVTTLLGYTARFDARTVSKTLTSRSGGDNRNNRDIKIPSFNFKVVRVDGTSETILVNNNYTLNNYTIRWNYSQNLIYVDFPKLDLSSEINIIKKYSTRTNVKFKLVFTITQANLEIEREDIDTITSGSGDHKTTRTYFMYYKGVAFTLTTSMFTGLSITASSETSTLSGVTGTGEIQYIAMEID